MLNRKGCFRQISLNARPRGSSTFIASCSALPTKDEDVRLRLHRSNAMTRQQSRGAWQSVWALRWRRGRRPMCHGSYCYRWIRPFIHWRRREGEPMPTVFRCHGATSSWSSRYGEVAATAAQSEWSSSLARCDVTLGVCVCVSVCV